MYVKWALSWKVKYERHSSHGRGLNHARVAQASLSPLNPESPMIQLQRLFSMSKWKPKQEIKNRLPLKLLLAVRAENDMIFSLWQTAPCFITWKKGEWELSEHLVWNLLIMVVKRELFHLEESSVRLREESSVDWDRACQRASHLGFPRSSITAFHHRGDVASGRNPWMTLSWKLAWNCVQGFHLWVTLGSVDMENLRKDRNLLLKLGGENWP